MRTTKLTTAQAIVKYLVAQRTLIDGVEMPLFPGVYAIFGHGNVTSLGVALEEHRDDIRTWRGQNEQGMALAALGFTKALRRRQIMVATSSIGPGALNMVTAAGVAYVDRLPLLLLSGDTFVHRAPDPVLQQGENFGDPTITVNDAFKPVVRYWDRIVSPEQLVQSLPNAVSTMLDPATAGPAFIGLPQDVQAEAWDFPIAFFERTLRVAPRPRADGDEIAAAVDLLRTAKRPLIIAGGGVHYSGAEDDLQRFAENHSIPVVETVAGKASLLASHPLNSGPVGVTGCTSANELAARADVVIALGTRLQDFTTGSWTIFRSESTKFVGINTARFDAIKHRSLPVVGDARETISELDVRLSGWKSDDSWVALAREETAKYHAYIDSIAALSALGPDGLPTYAQVVGVLDRDARPNDYVLTAAGGFPGELNNGWRAKHRNSFDCEYGFSCMGYEISGAWGAKMALPTSEVISLVGDGSYLMMNSDLYSTVLNGHKVIFIVCDNGGYAVIKRLQVNQGGKPFYNQLEDCQPARLAFVDFAKHAAAMGANTEVVGQIDDLPAALQRAREHDSTYVIVLKTSPDAWTGGGSFWEVGVPETSHRPDVLAAREMIRVGKSQQRIGW
ncbi:MAG: 3D-(3,5/4)-trihydroxycyclohexane-1,2-dione acylhydrolase (decyclizing) [Actinobacteria bacterium]|jgi:3D-(3,5/4)-trihydroxycyclohexane-1,2-dione acylhydrolase (decyclizing)|nr:3D-(3,5/4)-trihydroxycyclohexane-1,2-dione acylhydrolase (decyclizing) [Actinomycetota bacterium]NCW90530.1 3D-(3,5/4)-trihydroxycyclohexane-1,2-dione acylhydrolase (decyclizing) [Acidimicrobiia bacterium]NBS36092.1 3D-(3,5/4)-trihydroxycyclohexane-1,2-dione acylhydrolase (decyclizing) [Actinomycetota bacterium]NCV08817.1 3D-(3,5/4)-trihydroxycyclohexane-1,2-dione acylhydrolase (decyclizing) [Actinomycetota bacterium]NDA53357.1 3D-(3,5/4)-trihydroxycyclohexane-1,2-dione acylhydrolase (decycl